jgi:hypothetical protein
MADGIIFRTTDGARWGDAGGLGTGGNLTQIQHDENMWELLTRIQAIENDPPEAVGILNFTVIGSQFQVNMTDATTRGPYPLPIATFRTTGVWINDFDYVATDLVEDPATGLYYVRISHHSPVSPAVFDPLAIDEDSGSPTFGELLYQLVFAAASGGGGGSGKTVFSIHIPGVPGDGMASGDPIWWTSIAEECTLPADLVASAWVGAAWYVSEVGDGDIVFEVNNNGVLIATMTIPEGSGFADWVRADADPHTLIPGNILSVTTTTGTPTTNLRNFALTMVFDPT